MAPHPERVRPRTAVVARIVIGRRVRMRFLTGVLSPLVRACPILSFAEYFPFGIRQKDDVSEAISIRGSTRQGTQHIREPSPSTRRAARVAREARKEHGLRATHPRAVVRRLADARSDTCRGAYRPTHAYRSGSWQPRHGRGAPARRARPHRPAAGGWR